MNKEEQQEIDDLANELCYERIKFSYLWNGLENDQIDAKARELAVKIKDALETLIQGEEIALEDQEAA